MVPEDRRSWVVQSLLSRTQIEEWIINQYKIYNRRHLIQVVERIKKLNTPKTTRHYLRTISYKAEMSE